MPRHTGAPRAPRAASAPERSKQRRCSGRRPGAPPAVTCAPPASAPLASVPRKRSQATKRSRIGAPKQTTSRRALSASEPKAASDAAAAAAAPLPPQRLRLVPLAAGTAAGAWSPLPLASPATPPSVPPPSSPPPLASAPLHASRSVSAVWHTVRSTAERPMTIVRTPCCSRRESMCAKSPSELMSTTQAGCSRDERPSAHTKQSTMIFLSMASFLSLVGQSTSVTPSRSTSSRCLDKNPSDDALHES